MKSFFCSNTVITIRTIILFCFLFLCSCNHPGNIKNASKSSDLHENFYNTGISEQNSALPEIKSESGKDPVRKVHYDLVIPGRAMKSAEFTPFCQNTISLEGIILNVPAGCMKKTGILSVSGLLAEDLPSIPDEITNVTSERYAGYRFLPHGMLFDSTALISMAYDKSLIPEGFTDEDIYTFYFDENEKIWKTLQRDSIDKSMGLIVSRTLHFTDMINGIIKIPESPETEGFVPTTMTGIKAADPAAEITLIEPPAANNEGDAVISFPIKLPEGRSGRKPQLNLQYGSNMSSGWTGFGWMLDVAGISVDVSWGVPRYLAGMESETYMFEGSQLTPVAHRGEYIDRVSEKRFYSRIEEKFSRIIRHGNSPSTYWWEVTTKDGVRNYYGGLPGQGIITNAVSFDGNGNIGYWALIQTRDLHDNFIHYSYVKPENCGQQVYLSEITYTGHGTENGPYKVTLSRTSETNTYERRDVNLNARFGFIQRDRELLRRIEITYNNEPVRSYTLQFREGAFQKTLLESITELDASGNVFYAHHFDYYDDTRKNNLIIPFESEKSWTLPDDGLKSPYLNLFLDDVSIIGASGSVGASGKVAATVGLLDGKPFLKSMTAGGTVSYQSSKNEGFLTLTDINSDGLPDKVFKKDGGIYYRPNLLGYPSEEMFGEKKLLAGINDFSISKTSGFGWGAEASPPFSFIGYENNDIKTKTDVYFEDFNGDGLIDLVNNGVVYFNHINENGDPEFSTSSLLSPNPISANSQMDLSILPDPAVEQAKLEAQFPLHDAVRIWQAPYSGRININAPVSLIEDTSPVAVSDELKDGVKTVIQHNGNVLWSTVIEADDYTTKSPVLTLISVNKGDRIFFRVQSRFNGSYDKVLWDPEILYSSINASADLAGLEDSNGKIIGRYKASKDFVLTGNQSITLPKTGSVSIRSVFSKPALSDTLMLEIIRTDTLDNETRSYTRYYPADIIQGDSINSDIEVLQNEFIRFRILSSTNVEWSAIRWDINVAYNRIDDGTPLTGPDGKPFLSFKGIPEFSGMYNNPVMQELPVIADSAFMISLGLDSVDDLPHLVKISPYISFSGSGNDTVVLSVKTKNGISGKKKYPVAGNKLTSTDTLFTYVKLRDSLYLDYHFSNYGLAETTIRSGIIIGTDTLKASVFSLINPDHEIFGSLYRGWGQFDYNGNSTRADSPIDLSLLRLSDIKNIDVGSMRDTSDLAGIQNPLDQVFNMMMPYAARSCYVGTDEQVYVQQGIISSSRLGEKNVYVPPYNLSGTGLNAVSKVTEKQTKSVAGGLTQLSYSHSWGDDNITMDMLDMNGDRYPDLVSTDNIQYTAVSGALSGAAVNHSLGDHHSGSEADGFTLGGSYVYAKSNNSGSKSAQASARSKTGDNAKTNKNAESAGETSKSSIGLSGSFSTNDDNADETWLDINGDRLPDKVYSDGRVRLNMGYSFAPEEIWNMDAICVGESEDFGGGIGVNISNGSFTAGVAISKTDNKSTQTFIDINSDGLPDMVKGNLVHFNNGSGFGPPVQWTGLGALDAGESVGQSINAGFTVGIAIPILFIKICVNPSGSATSGVSHTLTQIADINGDGMPDFLSSDKEGELKVRSSTIFRTNILKTVERPLGGRFSLDYLLTPCTYRHPGGKLALASVKVSDGLPGDGADTSLTTFEYEDGFYNRHERQFYGFSSVKTHHHNTLENNMIYRTVEQQFNNSDYYTRGRMVAEMITDSEGRKKTGSQNLYALHDIHTGEIMDWPFPKNDSEPAFVALAETKKYSYFNGPDPLITTRITYSYDTIGNISGYTDYSSGNEKDRYSVTIRYHANAANHLLSIPSLQEVITIEGLKRKNETSVNEFGDITQIRKYITGDQKALFDMEYDEFGNLTKISRPANYSGERMWYEYDYDETIHTYIIGISDAYGYSSATIYDYKWGSPVEVTDRNTQKMLYSFDDCGRMTSITGPYELASGKPYSIAFEYHPEAGTPYARTLHYDSIYNSNIETYTFTDGLKRVVQVKKSALISDNSGNEGVPGYTVSGKTLYDAFNRVVEAYQPIFESAANPGSYNKGHDDIQPVKTTYDVLDRILQITLPDGSVTNHAYYIGEYKGEKMHVDSLTDALNHITINYTRANGRQAASLKKTAADDIINDFEYNALGELLTVTDPKGNKTIRVFDMLGNLKSMNQPDAGLTEYIRDGAGNLVQKITANLRKQIPEGGAITYKYDRERLVEIVYPRNIQNRVNYTYGATGDPFNRAGRVVLMQDASGGQEFFYSKLGQIIKTIRTIQLDESDMRTWIWSSTYDTWNRIHTMTYPDGEKVTYSYNSAGLLQHITGEKLGRSYTYISGVGYNKYEKQVYLRYGNGAVTTYNYDPKRQRLTNLNVSSKNELLMNCNYTYDPVSNILGITDSAEPQGEIGGATSHKYSYDELNQLTQAVGTFTGRNINGSYTLSMQYDIMGKIMHKTQKHIENDEEKGATTFDFAYGYDSRQPDAVTGIGSRIFTYDENGNQTGWQDTVTHDYRQLSWDEENRLTAISDNGYVSRYVYDASNERVMKSHGGTQGVYINGAPVGIVNHNAGNLTVYVSPYFVFRNDRFTKHYYNGSTRISSKVGNGQFKNQYRLGVFEITAGRENYINRQQQLMTAKHEYEKQSGIPPGPPTMKGIYADPEFNRKAYPDAGTPGTSVPRGWPKETVFAPAGGPPGAPVQWSADVTNENVLSGFGFVGNGNFEEVLRYFYHSDHLGSASYITNVMGNVTQYISYMPFGETFAEQHSDWESPYTFNAKELDNETGLYYFGARYYDPKISLWLGMDPLVEEHSGSPYVYCENNPVIYLDPDGKKLILAGTPAQKNLLLEHYQKLTGDRLDYNIKTGEVFGLSSPNISNPTGTNQIRELIGHKNTVTTQFSEETITGFAPDDPSRIQDAWNNTGVRSGTININPAENFELLVKDEHGKLKWEKSSLDRTIAHENEHALRALKGKAKNYETDKTVSPYDRPHITGGKILTEEKEVMDVESKIFPHSVRQRYTPRQPGERLPRH